MQLVGISIVLAGSIVWFLSTFLRTKTTQEKVIIGISTTVVPDRL
jgi:hypothetical protein